MHAGILVGAINGQQRQRTIRSKYVCGRELLLQPIAGRTEKAIVTSSEIGDNPKLFMEGAKKSFRRAGGRKKTRNQEGIP